MQTVHGIVTLKLQNHTWKRDLPSDRFESGWKTFSKKFFDDYPDDLCIELGLPRGTSWEEISKIQILEVTDRGFR